MGYLSILQECRNLAELLRHDWVCGTKVERREKLKKRRRILECVDPMRALRDE